MTRGLTLKVECAWSGNLTGVFRLDISQLDGTDGLGGTFGQNVFDDLTPDVKRFTIQRGRNSDLSRMEKGRLTLSLKDPFGKYNVENQGAIVNLCPNPSVETNLTGWSSTGLDSFTQSATYAKLGSYSMRLVKAALTGIAEYCWYVADAVGTGIPVTVGQAYGLSAYVKKLTATGTGRLFLWWHDAAHGGVAGTLSIYTDSGTHDWKRYSGLSVVAPATTTHCHIGFASDGMTAGTNMEVFIDGVQLEAGGPTNYVDGDQEDGRWSGTAHASTSYRGSHLYDYLDYMRPIRVLATNTTQPPNQPPNGDFERLGLGGADIWDDWLEFPSIGGGIIADEGILVHSGSHACKITCGHAVWFAEVTQLTMPVTPGWLYDFSIWARGDGANAGRYSIGGLGVADNIIAVTSTGVTAAAYSEVAVSFIAPAGCTQIEIHLLDSGVVGGISWFDDVSLAPRAFTMFHGFASRIEHNPDRAVQESSIEAVDLLEWLEVSKPTVAATGATDVGAAIGKILDAIEWDQVDMRDLDTGSGIADFSADGTKASTTLIEEMLAADQGTFFPTGSGVARYISRGNRHKRRPLDATLTGTLLQGVRPGIDVNSVVNRQAVTRTGGVAQTATDETSRRKCGYRDGSAITSSYLAADADALSLAQFLVGMQASGRPRVQPVRMVNISDTVMTHQLNREIGDLVRVTETKGGTDVQGYIEAIRHEYDAHSLALTTTWLLAKRETAAFTLDISEMDSGDTLSY